MGENGSPVEAKPPLSLSRRVGKMKTFGLHFGPVLEAKCATTLPLGRPGDPKGGQKDDGKKGGKKYGKWSPPGSPK